MSSSIRVSRGGKSIAFTGDAARAAFEGITGTKLPPKPPAKLPPVRCEYLHRLVDGGLGGVTVILLTDCDGRVSVTNDAEAVVVRVLHGLTGKVRIVYKDSEGHWDELIHVDGQFVDFADLTPAEVQWCHDHAP